MDWDDDSAIEGLDVDAINELARDHPGRVAFERWQPVALLRHALESNERELLDLVDRAESDRDLAIEVMQNVRPPKYGRFQFYAALTQRILNYAATTSALVEATRIAIRQYDPASALASQYAERKEKMLREPVIKLVNKGLRNYLLHYARPPVGMMMRADGGEGDSIEFTVVLTPEALLQFDGLDAETRTHLQAQTEPLSLRRTVREYGAVIGSLYSWVQAETERLHAPAVAQANRWIARMHGKPAETDQ